VKCKSAVPKQAFFLEKSKFFLRNFKIGKKIKPYEGAFIFI